MTSNDSGFTKCSKCGYELSADSKFCEVCGTPIEGAMPSLDSTFSEDEIRKLSLSWADEQFDPHPSDIFGKDFCVQKPANDAGSRGINNLDELGENQHVICSVCGRKSPKDGKFCQSCGFPFSKEETFVRREEPICSEKKAPKKSHKKAIVAICTSVISVAIVALLAVFLLIPRSTKELTAEDIYELVSPSVVEITGDSPLRTTTGTGFFYDDKGTIITNYHVIEGCTSAKITLTNGNSYKVDKVLGYDADRDIAILSTKCTSSTPLIIRESAVKTGETVYAIGSALGLSGSLSDGIISAAEREVDGQIYIQTTAPISNGNSGGPLLDKEGKVIGITSASFIAGQNLNLAIPINEVANISTKNPTTLGELFEQTGCEVEWLSDYRFQYFAKENTYVLLFQLADKNENPISASGTVNIRIVNNDGISVYNKSHHFSEDDFEQWIYDNVNEMYLATIYISPSNINNGSTEYGTVFFDVYGDNYSFDECSIEVFDLPVKPITIQLPQLPLTINDYGYYSNIQTTLRIDSITYEKAYQESLYIYFSGEKIYDAAGNNSSSWSSFEWKLYDSEGYLIEHGTFYTDSLSVGDKFKNKDVFVADGIKAGESYRLVIVGADNSTQSGNATQTPVVQPTCLKLTCNNVVAVSGTYCTEHKCANSTCTYEKDYDSDYCSVCSCMSVGCKNAKAQPGSYCTEHTCAASGCTSEKTLGKNYCFNHTCASCDNVRVNGGFYCVDHTCKMDGCTSRKTGLYSSDYCSSHQCLAGTCNKGRIEGGLYCEEHTCIVEGCTNQKLLDSYCYHHIH